MEIFMNIILACGIAFILAIAIIAYLEHCTHEYEIIKSFTTESEMEQIIRLGGRPLHCSMNKKYVTIFKCSKCGKIKKLTVTNY